MAVIRKEKTDNFTVMYNSHFKNKCMSLKAKGLLSLMLSLPDDWDYSLKGLSTLVSDGISGISSAIKELEKHGYLKRKAIRMQGKIIDWEYTIFECPDDSDAENLNTDNPDIEKPDLENLNIEKPDIENHAQLNTNISNTKELNTKQSNTKQQSTDCTDVYSEVVDSFNKTCFSLPCITTLTENRREKIDDILRHYTLEDIQEVFTIAQSNDFLKGVNRDWKASFDWLMCENNFAKVLEGNYNQSHCITQAPATEYDRFMEDLMRFVDENS